MDRILRRHLDAVARDNSSGAAQLALQAVAALRSWAVKAAPRTQDELLEVARALLRTQNSMAPFLRLAVELADAAFSENGRRACPRRLRNFERTLLSAPKTIAAAFAGALPKGPNSRIATYSFSSTVLKAILKARSRIEWVACSEGRPSFEGREAAEQLARAGMEVRFLVDAALPGYLRWCTHLALGADSVTCGYSPSTNKSEVWLANKVGTEALVSKALEEKKRIFVLTDTTKFIPLGLSVMRHNATMGPPEQIWPGDTKNLQVINPYFEQVTLRRPMRLLTESGRMTPRQIVRACAYTPLTEPLRKFLVEEVLCFQRGA